MATATVLTLAAGAAALALAVGAATPSRAAENPACRWDGAFRVCGGPPKPLLGPMKDITIRNPFYRGRDRDTAAATVASAAPTAPAAAAAAANTGAAPQVLTPSAAAPTALSRQAGALIAAGDCAGARKAVLTAGDLALAVQIDQLCKR